MSRFKRKNKLKAAAILSADWHIRPDVPVCRTDDFFQAMSGKLDFILNLSKEHDCPILLAGDIGRRPLNRGWPTWLLEWTIDKFKGHNIIAIPGQHDLPGHRIDLFEESGMGVLTVAGAIKTIFEPTTISRIASFGLYPFPYGQEIKSYETMAWPLNVAMTHQMIIENKPLWPDQDAPKGHQILEKFKEYNLILSGDNHNAFTVEYEGRWLVNPGSLMRTTADQIDHKPRVYLWYAETNTIEAVYLPIEQNVISRTHIEIAKNRENRNKAYIERMNHDIEIDLSYTNNLENYFKEFRTEKPIKDRVWESVPK